MKWVKLSTQFYNDPVFDDLTPNAERLFIRCLAFAGATETGGVLTQKQIRRVGILNTNRYVSELVANQLWVQTETGDYLIRSWGDWQESPSELEKRREHDRERKRKERQMSRDSDDGVQPLDKTREEESITPNGVIHTPKAPAGGERETSTANSASDETVSPEPAPELRLFDTFWAVYPRKVGKRTAKSKYEAAVKRAGGEHAVIDGARRLAGDPNLPTETRFIPHPSTWLSRDGWEDEPLPDRGGPRSQSANVLSLIELAREMDSQALPLDDYQMRELG